MLIHITPRLFLPCGNFAQLIDLTVDELGLVLGEGKDLATRRPYPNKKYLVGCRKIGRKAVAGCLIETEQPVRSYTTITRWALNAEDILTHRVHHIVLDDEFDAVTDNMLLWHGTSNWSSRWPECAAGLIPANAQPRMDAEPNMRRQGDFEDVISHNGLIVYRDETFRVPTIERGRLDGDECTGMYQLPSIAAAFRSPA